MDTIKITVPQAPSLKITIPGIKETYTKEEVDAKDEVIAKEIQNLQKYYGDINIVPSPSEEFLFVIDEEKGVARCLGCPDIEEVVIPYEYQGYPVVAFQGADYLLKLRKLIIPKSVTEILAAGVAGFRGSHIVIPDSVTIIGSYGFEASSLNSVTISNSVVSIGDNAFRYCEYLTDVYFKGTQEQWEAIEIGEGNEALLNANIHFEYAGDTYTKEEVDAKDEVIAKEINNIAQAVIQNEKDIAKQDERIGNAEASAETRLQEVETIIAPRTIIGGVQGFVMVSNGEPSNEGVGHNNTKRTDYIDITGYDKLVYTGRISALGYTIAFYGADKKILDAISVVGTGTNITKEIDLTSSEYSSAKYVIVSSFTDVEPKIVLSKNGNILDELDKVKGDMEDLKSSNEVIGFEKLRDVVISNNICDISNYEIGYYQYLESAANKYVYNNSSSFRTLTILNKNYHSITLSSIVHYYTLWNKDGKCIAGSTALGILTNYVIKDIDAYDNVHNIKVTIAKADLNAFMAVNGEIGVDFDEMPPYDTYGYRELYNLDINELKADVKTLKGKKIMLFGDSITDPAYNYSKWVTTMLKETGMVSVGNFAISGSKLAHIENVTPTGNHTVNKSVPNQVQYMLNNASNYEAPDIIIVFASTNDNVSTKVGYDSTQFDGELTSCDLTTFSGAMRWVYEKLMGQYPNALVIFITPLQSADVSRPYATQLQKRNAIIENCNRLATDYIDAFRLSGIYDIFEIDNANGKYLADGLHPNTDGITKIAKCVQNELMKLVYKL